MQTNLSNQKRIILFHLVVTIVYLLMHSFLFFVLCVFPLTEVASCFAHLANILDSYHVSDAILDTEHTVVTETSHSNGRNGTVNSSFAVQRREGFAGEEMALWGPLKSSYNHRCFFPLKSKPRGSPFIHCLPKDILETASCLL